MTLQSFVKHLLTEGDKLAVTRTSKLADQGGYAVASNYGMLSGNFLFFSAYGYVFDRISGCTHYLSTL